MLEGTGSKSLLKGKARTTEDSSDCGWRIEYCGRQIEHLKEHWCDSPPESALNIPCVCVTATLQLFPVKCDGPTVYLLDSFFCNNEDPLCLYVRKHTMQCGLLVLSSVCVGYAVSANNGSRMVTWVDYYGANIERESGLQTDSPSCVSKPFWARY
uniref:Thyroglobulin type-1 domain-containing protein n=1 Tax=Ascaris lumbricoides TaxID=6252 RepID=A0A0M3I889_ASCLU